MFKMLKIKLELIPDPGMYIFLEKSTWGGICYGSNRYNKVNNKYLRTWWPKTKHVTSLDVNNLYGYPMSKFFQTRGFHWIDTKEFNLEKYTSNSSKACFFEVDLEYPKELLELNNESFSSR